MAVPSLSTASAAPGCRGALPPTATTVATAKSRPCSTHRFSSSAMSSMGGLLGEVRFQYLIRTSGTCIGCVEVRVRDDQAVRGQPTPSQCSIGFRAKNTTKIAVSAHMKPPISRALP